jgi:PTH2 family peptidyl-tRNA hydrolase
MMQDHAQPSTANIAIACALVAGVTGYLIGQAKSLGLFGGSPISTPPRREGKEAEDSDESSDEDEVVGASELSEFPGHNEECKMVLVVRTDLGMTKGT